MFDGALSCLRVKSSDKFCVMQHLRLHAIMLASNGAVYDGGSGFNRNTAGGPRSDRAIDYANSRSIPLNVFYYLSNELVPLEWEADMHNVASGHRCGQIDIYAEGLMLALNNLHQCFADLSETDDNHNLLHGSGDRTTEIADLCPAVAELRRGKEDGGWTACK